MATLVPRERGLLELLRMVDAEDARIGHVVKHQATNFRAKEPRPGVPHHAVS